MKVSIDTRTLRPGDVFIPIKGPNFDGHDFIEEALDKGALKILDVDIAEYAKKYRKKLNCAVIAVTGSAGKTTMKDRLYYILKQRYRTVRSHENENNEIGVPLTILRADSDTQILIAECGMRKKGDLTHLARILRPSHVVITGVSLTHVETMGTPRNIALGKAELCQKAVKWEHPDRKAFINYTSNFYDVVQSKAEKAGYRVFPFDGPTKHDQMINACYMIARQFGMTDAEIATGLADYQPSTQRLRTIEMDDWTVVDDSYNANPDGVEFALQFLDRYRGRKILVLGAMLELGAYSQQAHQSVVEMALDHDIDIILTLGDDAQHMVSEAIPIHHFDTHADLIATLKDEIKSGDTILIKGSRGMKMENIVTGICGDN